MQDRPLNARKLHRNTQQSAQLKGLNKHLTLGFLTASIHLGIGHHVWRGVVDAAARHGVNLLCFPGEGLHTPVGFDAQRNVIYDLVSPAHLSGLVNWSSTITGSLQSACVDAFHQRYGSLPMVSLGSPDQQIPAVLVDSYQGMRAVISHLIDVHGLRRLAFIRGPAEHHYAQDRYRAYQDVLNNYGIPFAPELVTPHLDWRQESGAEAIRLLLDGTGLQPGVDLQAVVAASDVIALGALKALQARSIQVPGDLPVVGFNNTRIREKPVLPRRR